MKQRPLNIMQRGLLALFTASIALGTSAANGEVLLFSESFETDGAGVRYIVENPSDDGSSDYNARRQEGSPGTRVRQVIDGEYYWALRDLDAEGVAVGDLNDDDGRITWTEVIDISGLGDLRLTVDAAQGGDEQEWDNVVAFQIRIDGGEWITIGGFRGRHTNSPSHYFVGDLRTFPDKTNPRLTRTFSAWEWDISASGSTAEMRMFTNMNGGSEEVGFDNLRLYGSEGLSFASFSVNSDTYSETDGTGTLTVTLPVVAPAGGVTFNVTHTDADNDEVVLPETITIPEGSSFVDVPFDIVEDMRFDGDELVIVRFSGNGYARDRVTFTVENVDAKPKVIINEFLPVLNDLADNVPAEDMHLYDVNNDGRTDEDEEQFIEIVNLEDFAVDISGWTVNDELQTRHIFPEGTVLDPGGVILVFADAIPSGVFGGAIVQVTELVSPNFDEDGDIAQIVSGGAVVDAIAYTGELGETYDSITRFPDLTGTTDTVQDHSTIAEANGALWSPGTKVDGSYFFDFNNGELGLSFDAEMVTEGQSLTGTITLSAAAPAGGVTVELMTTGPNSDELAMPTSISIAEGQITGQFTATAVDDGVLDGDRLTGVRIEATGYLPDSTNVTVDDSSPDMFNIVVNEVFGDILGSGSDANANGVLEEPVADQFIEIVNAGTEDVNLAGWQLVSWRTNQPGGPQTVHIFPNFTTIPANGSVVIFGQGDEAALQALSEANFGGALIQVANNHGNGVNVTDEGDDGEVSLLTPYGHVEDMVIFTDDITEQNQAISRSPDITGEFGSLHLEVSGVFELASPGRQLDGTAFPGNGVSEATWAGYPIANDVMDVDTGDWLGWVNVMSAPYVFSYSFGGWLYLDESTVGTSGSWSYVFK